VPVCSKLNAVRRRCCRRLCVAFCTVFFAGAPVAVHGQEYVGSWTVEYRTQALKVETVEESSPEGNTRHSSEPRSTTRSRTTGVLSRFGMDALMPCSSQTFAPAGPLRGRSRERVREAGDDAARAFPTGVRFHRYGCSTALRVEERALRIGVLRRGTQKTVEGLRPLCERDMEVEPLGAPHRAQ
jgi:hypothetical protein